MAADTWTYSANLFNLTCASGSNTSQRGCGLAWTLSTHPQELLLVFEGLDTVADVYLGANRVLRASNFHRSAAPAADAPGAHIRVQAFS